MGEEAFGPVKSSVPSVVEHKGIEMGEYVLEREYLQGGKESRVGVGRKEITFKCQERE